MKKFVFLLFLVGAQIWVYGQNGAPQSINFQGVAIDKNGIPVPGMDELGTPLPNKSIRVRFSVLNGSTQGIAVFKEEHLTQTDEFGRFNLAIGRGDNVSGTFSGINWGENTHFLKVEIDLTGIGTDYRLASVQEFLSVPYALYAEAAKSNPNDHDRDSTNELQLLQLTGNLLEISSGNAVTLPDDNDQQVLSITGSTLSISNGNSVAIPDQQTLSIAGSSLSISNGNSIQLPPDSDQQSLALAGTSLSISNGNSVVLPPNTDEQVLSVSGNALTISNGNTITLPDAQTLSIAANTLSISNGNSVSLPIDSDQQNLILTGNNLSISNGNSVALPANTDHQTLSVQGNVLSISNGNSITLPTDNDRDSTNELQELTLNGDTLRLSKSLGYSVLPAFDRDTTNELQLLQVTKDHLKLSKGNQIPLDAILNPAPEFTHIEYAAGRYNNASQIFSPGPFHVGNVGDIISDIISFDTINGYFLSRLNTNGTSYVIGKVNFNSKALSFAAGGASGLTNGTGSSAGLNGLLAYKNPLIKGPNGVMLIAFKNAIKAVTQTGLVTDYLPQFSFVNIEGIYNGANNEIIIVENTRILRIQSNGTIISVAYQLPTPGLNGIADSTGYMPINGLYEVSNLVYNPTDNHYYAFSNNLSWIRCLIRIKADWTGFQSVGFNMDFNFSSFDGNYFNGTVNLGNWSLKFLQNNGNNNILYFIEGDNMGKVRRINLNTRTLTTHFYHPAIKGISKIGNKYYVTGLFLAELK
jgi:hypothetical protein